MRVLHDCHSLSMDVIFPLFCDCGRSMEIAVGAGDKNRHPSLRPDCILADHSTVLQQQLYGVGCSRYSPVAARYPCERSACVHVTIVTPSVPCCMCAKSDSSCQCQHQDHAIHDDHQASKRPHTRTTPFAALCRS
jgi:hypothetical protein